MADTSTCSSLELFALNSVSFAAVYATPEGSVIRSTLVLSILLFAAMRTDGDERPPGRRQRASAPYRGRGPPATREKPHRHVQCAIQVNTAARMLACILPRAT